MKIPQKPPVSIADITANPQAVPGGLAPFLRPDFLLAHADNYLHWDEIRRRPLPDGFADRKAYWTFLKMRRASGRVPVPLKEKSGDFFSFAAADKIQEGLSHADSHLRGFVDAAEPLSPAGRDMWMLQSLAEEEAIHSSLLEGARTTYAKAKKMLAAGHKPRNTGERMVLNNYRAMQYVRERKDEPLSEKMLCQLHRIIAADTAIPKPDIGKFRAKDSDDFGIWDNRGNKLLYAPPPAGELPGRMRALCDFANAPQPSSPFIHPVARAIILHFQMAYDHPFVDGNGRTARALFYWLMLKNGYWLAEHVSISKILLNASAKYGLAFLFVETDDGDLSYFVLHQLRVIKQAVAELLDCLKKQQRSSDRFVRRIGRTGGRFNERQREVLLQAQKNPHWRITVSEHRLWWNVVTQTARTDLLGLVDAGYLAMRRQGKAHLFYPTAKLAKI